MKAVVEINKNQFLVEVGEEVVVDRMEVEVGKKIKFDKILLLIDEKETKLGKPYIAGAMVEAEVLEDFKGKKIRVATYKAKARYRKVKGHRSLLTKLKITKIGKAKAGVKKTVKKVNKTTKKEVKK